MRFILFISFLFFVSGNLTAQKTYEQYNDESLKDVLNAVEKKNKITFFFESEAIEDYNIDIQNGTYSLQSILDLVFSQTRLTYETPMTKLLIPEEVIKAF